MLDVATGTGNAALLAAERGGRVVGVNFEPAPLRVATKRAREMGRELARVATIQVPVGLSRLYADWGVLRRLGRRGDRLGWPASWRISVDAALCVATVTQRSAVSPSGPRSAGPAIRGVAGHMVSDPRSRGDLKGRTVCPSARAP
ncbi:MAG: class I SAM-dependent methyltransferase [Acidimicrobiales bacterium]